MRGIGPDLGPAYLATPYAPYDAANGTRSKGHLYWTGPGIGEDVPLVH